MRIGFVGAGNMAMALAGAITASRPDTGVIAYDPDPARLDLCAREFDDFTPRRAICR